MRRSIGRTTKMRAFEARVGQPADEAIVEALNRCGSVPAAAIDLGLSYDSLLRWIDRLGIDYETKTSVVARHRPAAV